MTLIAHRNYRVAQFTNTQGGSLNIHNQDQETKIPASFSDSEGTVGQPTTRSTMANIENLKAFDAFDDAGEDAGDQSKIHIRVQQRNGRQCITTIQGFADDLDVKRICKAFKKNFSCNGAVSEDKEMGEVIQLSGDQRTLVKDFLVDQEIYHNNQIVIHGF